jgi:hypothetical protein
MRNVQNLTANEILNATKPHHIFTRDNYKNEYRLLAKKWHPDAGGDDQVFQHIAILYSEAEKSISDHHWGFAGSYEDSK